MSTKKTESESQNRYSGKSVKMKTEKDVTMTMNVNPILDLLKNNRSNGGRDEVQWVMNLRSSQKSPIKTQKDLLSDMPFSCYNVNTQSYV